MNFTTFNSLRHKAKKANKVITGSYILKEGDQYFNRLIWMRPDGSFEKYDKKHLFIMGNNTWLSRTELNALLWN
ncbi:MAG: hypothetical protein U5N85_13850 [Arcicella sp.]|nr:hypothetical protein [Arcicella sp.]